MSFLIDIYPYFIEVLLLFLLALVIFSYKDISYLFRGVKRKTWFFLVLILISGFVVRLLFFQSHLVVDEYTHINMAQQITFENNYCECLMGSAVSCQKCVVEASSIHFPAFQTMVGANMLVFGMDERLGSYLNLFFALASIIMVFLLSFLLFNRERVGLWAAFLLAFLPAHIKYSTTAILGVSSFFFLTLTLFSLLLFLKFKTHRSFSLFLVIFLFTIQIRPENLLVIPALLVLFLGKKGLFAAKRIGYQTLLLYFIVCLIFLIPFFNLLYFGMFETDSAWGHDFEAKVSLLKNNFVKNLSFWINPYYNMVLFPLLVLFGFFRFMWKDRTTAASLFLLFATFIIVYSAYYIGDFAATGFRYSLLLYLPLLLFAAFESDNFMSIFKYRKKYVAIFTLLLLASLFFSFQFIKLEFPSQIEHDFIKSNLNSLPKDVLVLSLHPSKIISMSPMISSMPPKDYLSEDAFTDNVFLFKDIIWHINKESSSVDSELSEVYTKIVLDKREIYYDEGSVGKINVSFLELRIN